MTLAGAAGCSLGVHLQEIRAYAQVEAYPKKFASAAIASSSAVAELRTVGVRERTYASRLQQSFAALRMTRLFAMQSH
jgi:hypothetical protein